MIKYGFIFYFIASTAGISAMQNNNTNLVDANTNRQGLSIEELREKWNSAIQKVVDFNETYGEQSRAGTLSESLKEESAALIAEQRMYMNAVMGFGGDPSKIKRQDNNNN